MSRRGEYTQNPKNPRVRSSGMRAIDYWRYQKKRREIQDAKLTVLYARDEARHRSYMSQSFGNMPLTQGTAVLIGKKFKLRTWWAKPEPTPWIIHVQDGKPLTAHGAKLLGVPFTPSNES